MGLGNAMKELNGALENIRARKAFTAEECRRLRFALECQSGLSPDSCSRDFTVLSLTTLAALVHADYSPTLAGMPVELTHKLKENIRLACTNTGHLCTSASILIYFQDQSHIPHLGSILTSMITTNDSDALLQLPGGIEGVRRVLSTIMAAPAAAAQFPLLVKALEGLISDNARPRTRGAALPTSMEITFRTHPTKPRPRDLLSPPAFIVPIVLDKPLVSLEAHFNSLFHGYWYDFIKPLYHAIADSNARLNATDRAAKGRSRAPVYQNLFLSDISVSRFRVDANFRFRARGVLSKKRLSKGSLVVVSADRFEHSFLFGTIGEVESSGKRNSIVTVGLNFFNPREVFGGILGRPLSLIESPSLYAEAQHVLKAVQQFNFNNLTFPKTLRAAADMGDEHIAEEEGEFDKEFALAGMDASQQNAMQLIMRSRFPIVQGPPGTGKTFIGVRAVLSALGTSLGEAPILILCYTNHAVDSFLRDILEQKHPALQNGGAVIRLGRSTKDPEMEKFQLNRQLRGSKDLYTAKEELELLCEEFHRDPQAAELVKFKNELKAQNYRVKRHIEDLEKQYERLQFEQESQPKNGPQWQAINNQLGRLDDEYENLKARLVDPDNYVRAWIGNLPQWQNAANNDEYVDNEDVRNFNSRKISNCVDMADLHPHYTQFKESIDNGHLTFETATTPPQRAAVIFHEIQNHKQNALNRMAGSVERFSNECEQLELRAWEECLPQVQGARIIAATTTGMSKLNFLVAKTNPRLVILEEAAEIAEPHALGAIFPSCRKIIQIGDHQQLRPKVTEIDSATKHHMDVSLMERLIRSGNIEFATLCTQRRMRPEICMYTSPLYDERLREFGGVGTHKIAHDRPPLTTLGSTVVFLNHTMPEQVDDATESESKVNKGEAEFVVQLAEYLSKQIDTDDLSQSGITVLAPYTGQVRILRKKLIEINLGDVRVASVDDFQGEENDVVILSLVRSEAVGFLATENRICVALSRARRGMIVVGNLEFLEAAKGQGATQSTYWRKVVNIARQQGHLMDAIPLYCPRHKVTNLVLATDSIRRVSPMGGCNARCGARRACGHVCERNCHPDDCENVPCSKPCARSCPVGHPCKKTCSETCQCMEMVLKTFRCDKQHKATFPCHEEPDALKCPAKVIREYTQCTHTVNTTCGVRSLPPCKEKCDHPLRGCEHKCSSMCGTCKGNRLAHPPCGKVCGRPQFCGHVCKETCAEICRPCIGECDSECPHGKCTRACGIPCAPCMEPCLANSQCPHGRSSCSKRCGEPCDVAPCPKRCPKKLDCGHQCRGLCGEDCPNVCFDCTPFDPEKCEEYDPVFYMAEEDSLFLRLHPCGHELPVDSMDGWVRNSVERNLPFLECPQCRRRIAHSYRYQSTLFEGLTANLFRGAQELKANKQKEAATLRQQAIDGRNEIVKILDPIQSKECPFVAALKVFVLETTPLVEPLADSAGKKKKQKRKDTPTWCERVALAAQHLRLLTAVTGSAFDQIPMCTELDALVGRPSRGVVQDICRMVQVRLLEAAGIKVNHSDALGEDGDEYLKEQLLHLVSPPTFEEMRAIHAALASTNQIQQRGAWNRCRCGFMYVIGDCGGATVTANCPQCNRTIGGTNHRNINEHVGDFDGSVAHAWPQNR